MGIVGTPTAVFYFGLSSSNALGVVLVSVVVLWFYGARSGPVIRQPRVVQTVLLVCLALLLHLALAATVGRIEGLRAVASLIPLTLMIFAGAAVANVLIRIPPRRLHRGLLRSFGLLCALALLSSTGWAPPTFAESWHRPVFPFSEPSAFALAFTPVLMYGCVTTQGYRRLGVLVIGLGCSTAVQSLTLVAGVVLVMLVSVRWHTLLLLAFPLTLGLAQFDLTYYGDRLDVSGDVQNLSNLVYLQGWQMVGEALARSAGVGLGFQQLGVHGTDVPAAEVLRSLRDGEDLNLLDGGFTFAKFAGEFGIVGISLTLAFVMVALRSARTLGKLSASGPTEHPATTLARCIVVAYLVDLFVRSSGYFSGSTLLMLVAITILSSRPWAATVAAGAASGRQELHRHGRISLPRPQDLNRAPSGAAT